MKFSEEKLVVVSFHHHEFQWPILRLSMELCAEKAVNGESELVELVI